MAEQAPSWVINVQKKRKEEGKHSIYNAPSSSGSSGSSRGSSGSSSSGSSYTSRDTSGRRYEDEVGMSASDKDALYEAGKAYNDAIAAGDHAAADRAHAQAEAIRNKYNYSGGIDGSEYIPIQTERPSYSYEDAPTFTSKYQDQIDELLDQILNRDEFSYNYLEDPLYQQFSQSYTRNGQRAMQDTLGQMAARTGGLASSYAATASQQAYDNYMSALADKVPELQQLAYAMYQDEGDRMNLQLDMLRALDDGDWARYQDLLDQYNADREFDYGVWRDEIADSRYDQEWDYQVGRDQISDSRYEDELAWNRGQYADETEYARALERAQTLAAAGDFSGYRALGYTDDEIANLQSAYAREQAASRLSSSGGRSSGGSGGTDTQGGGDVYSSMYEAGVRSEADAYAWLLGQGYSSTEAGNLAEYFANMLADGSLEQGMYESAVVDMGSVLDLGYGPINEDYLAELEARGEIESYVEDGRIKFRKVSKNEEDSFGALGLLPGLM